MKILHPDKSEYLPLEELREYFEEAYYSILSNNEKKNFNHFLVSFEEFRTPHKIYNSELYPNLPFSINSPTWNARVHDLKIIDATIDTNGELDILDVGCWNGWLCNYYAKKGNNVVGTGLFTDQFDGLKSSLHYQSSYISLQLPMDELNRIQHKFDLIIFNRCWAYALNPSSVMSYAKNLLKPQGKIILTGLIFYGDPNRAQQRMNQTKADFFKRFGIPLFSQTMKGYLDHTDAVFLKEHGVQLSTYHPVKDFVKKWIFRAPYSVQFGIYEN